MKVSKTITYELEDVPVALADGCRHYDIPLILRCVWDSGVYRLRLMLDSEADYWDKIATDVDDRYLALFHDDFDGYYNWGVLDTGKCEALMLLRQYAAHQRALYPGLRIEIEED